ncbi:MAG: DUF3987 domain-containing protein, partial [Magnetococcus sp. DMHC-8]
MMPVLPTLLEIRMDLFVAATGWKPKGKSGLLEGDRLMVLPIHQADGAVVSVQMIDEVGRKAFLSGSRVAGGYWVSHVLPGGDGAGVSFLVGEGVATALSALQGKPGIAVASMMDSNLPAVAQMLRARYPSADIVLLADLLPNGEPNRRAVEAAQAVGGRLFIPSFGADRQHAIMKDANDVLIHLGLETVARQLAGAKRVEAGQADTGASDDDWPDIEWQTARNESPPFPAEALPPSLLSAAAEVARFTKTDVSSASAVGLSVAATAIGKSARIEERSGLYHHPALFIAIVADSGERKTPVNKAMATPLESWSDDQKEVFAQKLAIVQAENAVAEAQIASLRRLAGKEMDDAKRSALVRRMAEEGRRRQPLPPAPRLYTTDCTEEMLFRHMAEHDGCFAVISGEGRPIIDQILGKFSGQGRTGDGIYLAGVSGDVVTRDRVGSGLAGPENLAIAH